MTLDLTEEEVFLLKMVLLSQTKALKIAEEDLPHVSPGISKSIAKEMQKIWVILNKISKTLNERGE